MTTSPTDQKTKQAAGLQSGIIKRGVQVILLLLIQAAILFIANGSLAWLAAWVFLGVYLLALIVNALVVFRKDPQLMAERAELKEGAKKWDVILVTLISLVLPLFTLLIAGLDHRFGWSPQISLWIRLLMLVAIFCGYGLITWAMTSNPFFSGVVRIQKERGHSVASAGPYRFVRHPGYVGMLCFYLATPVFLGSLWGLVPGGTIAVLLVIRTALEDKTLRQELTGYQEYSNQVRYRLIPGIW